jgi:hypothetical protein
LISSKDAAFSKAEVSPSFSPKYAARTIRRITFAFPFSVCRRRK